MNKFYILENQKVDKECNNTLKFMLTFKIPNFNETLKQKVNFYINDILEIKFEIIDEYIYIYYFDNINIDSTTINVNNNKILSLVDDKLYEFLDHLNIHNYIKLKQTEYYKKYKLFINDLIKIDKKYLKNIVGYSGVTLFMIGCTYTKDIDIVFINIDHNKIKKIFGKIIQKNFVDYCYLNQIDNNMYDKNDKIHHNNKTLKQINFKNIVNYAGFNILNPSYIYKFYQLRLIEQNTEVNKSYVMYDLLKLVELNGFYCFGKICHSLNTITYRDLMSLIDLYKRYDDTKYTISQIVEIVNQQIVEIKNKFI